MFLVLERLLCYAVGTNLWSKEKMHQLFGSLFKTLKKTIGAFGRILLEYFLQGEMTWEVFSVETLQFGITVPVCL